MTSRVTFLGDVHGDWQQLRWAMLQNPDTDIFIQVGDFGIMPKQPACSYPKNKGFGRPVFFIDGNHDDHTLLASRVEKNKLEIVRNVFYVPRASSLNIEGVTINCIGGAESIDQYRRISGKTWWAEEIPSYEESSRFGDLPSADIVVTHTAPMSIVEDSPIAEHKLSDPFSHDLSNVLRCIDYTPKLWLFGHFHDHFAATVNGTQFQCLPCVHEHNGIAPFAGVTVTLDDGKILT